MKGFKDFITRGGNLIEMAVAFIMAAAFADVVKSFTAVIMDLIGKLLPLDPGTAFSSVAVGGISIGAFLTALFSFLIIALVLYFAVITPLREVQAASRHRRQQGQVRDRTAHRDPRPAGRSLTTPER